MDGDSESISQSTRRAPCVLQFALTIQLFTSTGMCCFLLASTLISNGMRHDAHVTVPCRN